MGTAIQPAPSPFFEGCQLYVRKLRTGQETRLFPKRADSLPEKSRVSFGKDKSMGTAMQAASVSLEDVPLLEDVPAEDSEDVPDEGSEDEYYYGYRTIIEDDEDGNCSFSYRPLTLDDFLEPEEGDVYMQGTLHEEDVGRLRGIFRHHLRDRENVTVYSDLKIEWGISGLENPAPDVSVFSDVKDPKRPRGTFSVPKEGLRPFFVLEVVSPRYRRADIVSKPRIYRTAGVSEYIIIDPGLKRNKISYTLSGYRMIGNRYVKIVPDPQGRIRSLTTGVIISVSESKEEIIVSDARTGERILPDDEARDLAEARAEQEKARAEQEKARAEQEKARAEQEKSRAEQEKSRAEQEKVRAESAEEELRQLRAKLKALEFATD